jgi:hypothetical protein
MRRRGADLVRFNAAEDDVDDDDVNGENFASRPEDSVDPDTK